MLDCSVVIVNYRSADLVSDALRAIAGERPREVVVIDNASGDGSVETLRARHPDVRVIARPSNDGFAAGVNAGFAATSGEVVILLNPDTVPRPGALARLVEHLATHPRTGVAAPLIVEADGTPQPGAYRRFPNLWLLFVDLCLPVGWIVMRIPWLDAYRMPPSDLSDGAEVAHVVGAAMAIRRAAHREAGPLDEGFFLYLEETEWQERVRRAGWAVAVVPSAEVVHLVRGGGHAATAPSPHFIVSMRRYLALRRVRPRLVSLTIDVALALSRVAARAEDLVIPPERRTGGARAAAYDALWRERHAGWGPR